MKKLLISLISLSVIFFGIWWYTRRLNTPEKHVQKFACISCALQQGETETIGGLIAETPYFEVRQDFGVPIPGFMIVAAKRHITSILDFTPDERRDFIDFVYRVRKGMQQALGIDIVYLIEEEDAKHFHLWLFPWHPWMKNIGTKLKAVKLIMQYALINLNTQEHIKQVEEYAERLRKYLSKKGTI